MRTRGLVALLVQMYVVSGFSPLSYVVSGFSRTLYAQSPASAIHVLEVRPNIHMLSGAGGNITVQTGKSGVLLVDTPPAALAKSVLAQIASISRAPIRYVINTSSDADHAGGNAAIGATGVGGGGPNGPNRAIAVGSAQGMTILAHERTLDRMNTASVSQEGLPTSTYDQPTKDFSFNGEAIIVYHAAAHTDGDSIVMFRGSDVVSAGDVFAPDRYPMIDVKKGGSVQGVIDGLNLILMLTVPEAFQEGGTKVIPGHGRLCDESDVVEYRDMVWIVRDRIADLMQKGMTLAQIKAAKPTSDYDAEYDSPAMPADAFVEAVFTSLMGTTR
ncbi:MAG TPA: MBL fold metallo-hydrolase [Vicinamibacterales bacterium]